MINTCFLRRSNPNALSLAPNDDVLKKKMSALIDKLLSVKLSEIIV